MRRPLMSSAQACLDLGVSTAGPAPSRKPKGSDTGLHEHGHLEHACLQGLPVCWAKYTSLAPLDPYAFSHSSKKGARGVRCRPAP